MDWFFSISTSANSQFGLNRIEPVEEIDGERNAHFGSRDHINRRLEAVEEFEDAMKESVGHEHTRGVYVDERDLAFAGDGFDHIAATHRLGDDARAGDFGAARIENQ